METKSLIYGNPVLAGVRGRQARGMVGAAISESERFNLIGMWVEPSARGSGIAKELMDIVKAQKGGS